MKILAAVGIGATILLAFRFVRDYLDMRAFVRESRRDAERRSKEIEKTDSSLSEGEKHAD
jgi:hypothetical protein